MDMKKSKIETATFSAGCFWGAEETFAGLKGVKSAIVGYAGGSFENPTYENVSSGKTGHAESIEVKFNPKIIPYRKLLDVFWENHDPTTPNRQGLDVGTQYRSMIFCYSAKQKEEAEKSKKELKESGKFKNPIVTEIVPAGKFWKAEEYHQGYLKKRGMRSCRI
jgi:peptide-methionine (S)-S-oxide reductase